MPMIKTKVLAGSINHFEGLLAKTCSKLHPSFESEIGDTALCPEGTHSEVMFVVDVSQWKLTLSND